MTDNIEMFREGDILTIVVDLSKEYGPSSTGKTIVVASSKGNRELPDSPGIFMGLNIYKKP